MCAEHFQVANDPAVKPELMDALNAAYDAIDELFPFDPDPLQFDVDASHPKKNEVHGYFREFSEAEFDAANGGRLQDLINDLGQVREPLTKAADLVQQAHDNLASWHGEAADNAKVKLLNLRADYVPVNNGTNSLYSALSVLEADVVAMREIYASARDDLRRLTQAFRDSAGDYQAQQKAAGHAFWSKLLAGTADAVIAGALVVVTGGLAAGVEAASVAATGTLVDTSVERDLAGGDPQGIYDGYIQHIQDIESHAQLAVQALVTKIHSEIQGWPPLTPPPDVSPGNSFDPDDFGTAETPDDIERGVRGAGRDIPAADGARGDHGHGAPGKDQHAARLPS